MIRIDTVTASVVTTLYERSSNLVNPYYTWEIINSNTLETTVFYADDVSTAPWYYNTFNLTISTTMSGPTAGIVNAVSGQYTYNIYEMANQYDLDINNAINFVETGIMYIVPTYSAYATYTQSDNATIVVYNNLDRI